MTMTVFSSANVQGIIRPATRDLASWRPQLMQTSEARRTLDLSTNFRNNPSDVGFALMVCAGSARLQDDEESGQSAEEDL